MSILECWLFFKVWKKTFCLRDFPSLSNVIAARAVLFSRNPNLRSLHSTPLLKFMYISYSYTSWSLFLSCDEQTWFSSSCLAIVKSIQSFWSRRLMLLHSTPWKMVLNHQERGTRRTARYERHVPCYRPYSATSFLPN